MAKAKTKTGTRARGASVGTTPFVAAFVAEFIQDDTAPDSFKWPTPQDDRTTIQKDFGAVMALLLEAALTVKVPRARAGDSFVDRVATFAAEQRWPLDPAVPPQWKDIRRTARFIEISLIVDHMLEGINAHRPAGAPGGGASSWPPHGRD